MAWEIVAVLALVAMACFCSPISACGVTTYPNIWRSVLIVRRRLSAHDFPECLCPDPLAHHSLHRCYRLIGILDVQTMLGIESRA